MLYVISCVDKPDHLQVRLDNRPAHVEFLKSHSDHMLIAGPTLTDDGETMNGSVLILDFENKAAAEAFCAADPYTKAGLFESTSIRAWKKVLPAN